MFGLDQAAAGSLEECLKLLKGNIDEQRLVGLLLATKFVSGNNVEAVRQVFDAVGIQFINRLLETGAVIFPSFRWRCHFITGLNLGDEE